MSGKSAPKVLDVVTWDDIDLDAVLGEYTDSDMSEVDVAVDDILCEPPSEDDNENDSATLNLRKAGKENNPPKQPSKEASANLSYQCPVCSKVLRSISGFRGHVIKQHDRPDLKASKHRVGRNEASEQPASTPPSGMDLDVMVQKGISQAIDAIINHKLRNSEASRLGSEVVAVARLAKEGIASGRFVTTVLEQHIVELFQGLGLPVYAQEREALFTAFHQLRCDRSLRMSFLGQLGISINKAALGFYQQLLREALGCIITEATAIVVRVSTETRQQKLSAAEQNILFYITGYMARKVATCKLCMPAVKAACTSGGSSDELGFVSEYSAWTATVNRGGLLNPSQNFYLLIRTMDRVHSQHLNLDNMTSDSLNRCILTEAMMSDINVKHHWNAIVKLSAADEDLALHLLEYIVRVFVTVKGFAVARYLRGRLNTESNTSVKSTSLRHSLR